MQMSVLDAVTKKVLEGGEADRTEALALASAPLGALCAAADAIRAERCGSAFDLCAIVNAKSGRCSEDCRFCAQSSHNRAHIAEYGLLPAERVIEAARKAAASGALRFSLVTSGGALSDGEIGRVCGVVGDIKRETGLSVCLSVGLLAQRQYARLAEAGADRIHNNLETSENYFPKICSTHKWREKTAAIKAAQAAGLSVCSGGIIGMGETAEDRIDFALAVRELGVRSVPVNILNPIKGTPLEGSAFLTQDEILRTVAVFRFILPDGAIRMAGGRGLMPDGGKACFTAGSNAAITGDMLTTSGVEAARDIKTVRGLGYEVRKIG